MKKFGFLQAGDVYRHATMTCEPLPTYYGLSYPLPLASSSIRQAIIMLISMLWHFHHLHPTFVLLLNNSQICLIRQQLLSPKILLDLNCLIAYTACVQAKMLFAFWPSYCVPSHLKYMYIALNQFVGVVLYRYCNLSIIL